MSKIVVKCGAPWLEPANLKILKSLTKLAYSEIARRIAAARPVAEFRLFFNDHEEIESVLRRLLAAAEEKRLACELFEIGDDEDFAGLADAEFYKITTSRLRNIFESGRQTRLRIERADERRFKEKS